MEGRGGGEGEGAKEMRHNDDAQEQRTRQNKFLNSANKLVILKFVEAHTLDRLSKVVHWSVFMCGFCAKIKRFFKISR